MTAGAAEPLRFSVIVASWQRPFWLKRCLLALSQLAYPEFEIVVVADQNALSVIDGAGLKMVPFPAANLSAARNAGVAASGGDICAFIDDDAAPEPMWLAHLADAFRLTGAGAVAGYVRGRNGISFQSRVASVDREAETHIEAVETASVVPELQPGRALKLVGSNMAVRREVFAAVGEFDEAYRYFLEDTDLSLRIAAAGVSMAVAPLAEVHHAFAPSLRRSALRTPVDLFDIGRSSALFLRRHLGQNHDAMFDRIHKRERGRLLRHMVLGACEPRDVDRILSSLSSGWADGMATPLEMPATPATGRAEFRRFPTRPDGHVVLTSRLFLRRRAALKEAERIARTGQRVSLFSFSLTPIRHHVRFTACGVWLQTGGLFGRSQRNRSIFRWCRFADRFDDEIRRVAKVRGIGEKEVVKRWD